MAAEKIHTCSRNEQYIEWLCLVIMLIKIMSILIFNLTRLKYIVDYDSSVPLAQAIEMWQQKTIFLKGWAYQTTLGLV